MEDRSAILDVCLGVWLNAQKRFRKKFREPSAQASALASGTVVHLHQAHMGGSLRWEEASFVEGNSCSHSYGSGDVRSLMA